MSPMMTSKRGYAIPAVSIISITMRSDGFKLCLRSILTSLETILLNMDFEWFLIFLIHPKNNANIISIAFIPTNGNRAPPIP